MSDDAPRRAVVIDDNLMFAMMVEPALRREGYDARTLAGGASTVDELAAAPPDVVFVNLTSNRYDGPDLVRRLRAREELTGVPLVGYAGHVERHFFQTGKEAGADMVVPNSAVRKSIPEVLRKLDRLRSGTPVPDDDWEE